MSNYIEYINAGSGEAWPIRDAEALHKSGGTMAENIDMGGHKIAGLNAPTDGQDAANKKYVDDQMEEWKDANPLNFAPSGFGLGETTPNEINTIEQLDACRACGFYRYKISGSNICGISFAYSSLIVYSLGPNSCTQELRPINTNYCLRRYYYHEIWSEWELIGLVQKKLWETASRTSSFAAQTLSLDLSGYDEVLIYSCLEASTNNDYMVVSRCPVGERALAHFTWGDDNVSLHRLAKTNTSGIQFFSAYHGGSKDDASMMPYQIYGIKGVSE